MCWIYINDTRIDTGELRLKPVFAIFLSNQRMHGVFRLTGNAQISEYSNAQNTSDAEKYFGQKVVRYGEEHAVLLSIWPYDDNGIVQLLSETLFPAIDIFLDISTLKASG